MAKRKKYFKLEFELEDGATMMRVMDVLHIVFFAMTKEFGRCSLKIPMPVHSRNIRDYKGEIGTWNIEFRDEEVDQ